MQRMPTVTKNTAKPAPVRGRPRLVDAEALVLGAVARLLETYPVHLITMELVAEQSGVSKITLYRRWPTRLALLVEAMLQRLAVTMVLDGNKPPADAIRNHVVNMVKEFNGVTGTIVRGIVGACFADPDMSGALREHYLGARRDLAIQIIQQGQADGSFAATGPADVLADMLYATIWYRFLFQVGELSRKQALGLLATVLRPT
jgi:AcrR family transcriptional regulator